MPDIIPSHAPSPRCLLAWDGTAYRPVTIDDTGHLQIDVLTPDALRGALHSINTDELVVRGEDQLISYKDRLAKRYTGAISGAGGYFESAAVPAGEVWEVTNVVAQDVTSATTEQRYDVDDGVSLYTFYAVRATIAAAQFTCVATHLYLKAGDKVRVYFTGALAANTIYLFLTGYSMTKEV